MGGTYKIRCQKCKAIHDEIPYNTTVLLKATDADGNTLIGTPATIKQFPDLVFTKVKKHEELYGGMCSKCSLEYEMKADAVLKGGVLIQCDECGKNEVVPKENPVSAVLREEAKLSKPNADGSYPPLVAHFEKCSEHVIGIPNEILESLNSDK